ncbi:GEVED domain-containing protein [uncultured Flavobacterium sp.]|mgnify:CR=1 FL=1|uniref:T9SS sorting signal type C domain-containing protein n=1 Tax=uncultured Flavobacterium sp. TaxID=165435 RepID=UPI0030EC8E2A|tara:strand:+ start:38471 stop:43534 length:5064 start_codon:yes stop_codon:yes gene_type:complete
MKKFLLIITFLCSIFSWGQASLPVNRTTWTGATPTGWIDSGTGNYTSSFACSGNNGGQFDDTNDYYQVFFTGTPNQLTYDIKISGSATSSLLVQESANGSTWTTVVNHTTLPTSCTNYSYTLNSLTRYVRWTYNKVAQNVTIDDVIITTPPNPNTITTNTAIAGSPFCVTGSTSASVSVPFTSTDTFTAGNVYTAQLSNTSGSFVTPINIGTLSSTANSGTISATIPAGTAAGTGYRIRVVSSAPTVIGTDNTVNLTVNLANVTVGPTATQNIFVSTNGTLLTATENAGAISRQWYYGTVSGGPYGTAISGATATTYTPNFVSAGTYYVVCVSTYSCGTVTSGQVRINVSLPPNVVLSSSNPAVAASTISQATTNNVIYKFDLAVTNFNAVLTAITFVTTGSAATSSITNFKAWYSTDAIFSSATDTFLNNLTTGLGAGSHTFNGFSQTIPTGTTGTIFITTDIPCAATVGNTIIVNAITTADLTFTAGTKSGTAFASGTHTIQTATPNNVTGVTTSVCANGTATINWTSPVGCSDNIFVYVTDGIFTSAVPTGNGGTYNAITTFGGGTPFDGGFTIYKGTGNSVTVTGLTNGDTYVFKVFTRNGLVWSSGITVNCTPNITYCVSGATSNLDSEIENVTLVGVNNSITNNTTNVCTSGVNNYTAMSADLQVGTSNTLTVEFGDCNDGIQYNGAGGVWIDWNKDGDFDDPGETIGTTLLAVSGGNIIQNFTISVPVSQPLGFFRMRIVQREGGTLLNTLPCATFNYGSIEDYTIQVINTCIPTHSVTSFTPISGPVGTEVAINGTGLAGATVNFSGISATIISTTSTQVIAIIPSGATTGNITVFDSQPCAIVNTFTINKNDKSSCEGTSVYNDLILYEIHDEESGSGGTITLYNGTATTKVLSNYRIYRAGTAVSGTYSNYATLTGSIAPGAIGIIKVTPSDCGPASTNGSINSGFNANDGIQLRNATGSIVIDDVNVPSSSAGYFMKRVSGAYTANSIYVTSDWTSISLATGQCATGLAVLPAASGGNSPLITAQPAYSPNCGSVVLATAATEGFAGGFSLVYQWYVNVPGSATWTLLTNSGVYTGATSATLSISSTSGLNNYQYYCQVRENSATCFTATNAVKIKDDITTWNGTTWTYGAPTLARKAILNGNYTTGTNGNFECCTLEVNATRTLTVSGSGYVVIDFNIINNGNIVVENNGSIVQIKETDTNIGTYTGTKFQVNRIAQAKNLDYVYWSSPINGFAVSNLPNSHRLEWDPTATNANSTQGNWLAASGNMITSKGYIARASNGSATAVALPVVFQGGKPNNGSVSIGIARGSTTGIDDTWNLIGNPYPSAMSASSFVTENTNIEGSVRLWTHGSVPINTNPSPFYQNFGYNYSDSDYIVSNGTGSTTPGAFDGNIASGQGFFIRMLEDGETDVNPPTNTITAASSSVIFKNSYRRTAAGVVYDNSAFFRNSEVTNSTEKSRIWLDLISPNNELSRTLIGYVPDATLAKDRMFDALIEADAFKLYTLINTQKQTIQGRPVPFDTNDQVPVGMFVETAGNYTVAIASVDGLFSDVSQHIYLEDKVLNVIHDLRQAPYIFATVVGEFNDRFVLRYTNTTLSNQEFESTNDLVIVSNEKVSLLASQNIKSVLVFDMLGRKIYEKNNINSTEVVLDKLMATKEALIIKTTFEDGKTITKKIIY